MTLDLSCCLAQAISYVVHPSTVHSRSGGESLVMSSNSPRQLEKRRDELVEQLQTEHIKLQARLKESEILRASPELLLQEEKAIREELEKRCDELANNVEQFQKERIRLQALLKESESARAFLQAEVNDLKERGDRPRTPTLWLERPARTSTPKGTFIGGFTFEAETLGQASPEKGLTNT